MIPNYSREDTKYGVEKENELEGFFNNYFETKFQTTEHYNDIDYICKNKKIIIELKSRRCVYKDYQTTMISLYKIKSLMKKVQSGYNVYLFFNFTDGLYFYKLEKMNNEWIQSGGRMDRGKFEYKHQGYYYIPIEFLEEAILLPKESPVLFRQNAMNFKSINEYFEKKII